MIVVEPLLAVMEEDDDDVISGLPLTPPLIHCAALLLMAVTIPGDSGKALTVLLLPFAPTRLREDPESEGGVGGVGGVGERFCCEEWETTFKQVPPPLPPQTAKQLLGEVVAVVNDD